MDSRDVIAIPIPNECNRILHSRSHIRRIEKSKKKKNLEIMDLAIERLSCFERLLQITFETSCGFSSFVADLVHLRRRFPAIKDTSRTPRVPEIPEGRIPLALRVSVRPSWESLVNSVGLASSRTRVPGAIDQWILQESPRGDSKR